MRLLMKPFGGLITDPSKILGPLSLSEYADKVLGIQSANLIGYWPFWEAAGLTADNYEGTAARDGTYAGVTLGQPGIGDGHTCPLFNASPSTVDCHTASHETAFNGDEGTFGGWAIVSGPGDWTDGVRREMVRIYSGGVSSVIWLAKDSVNNQWWFRYNAEGTVEDIRVASGAPTDWTHLALTWSVAADEVKAYVDGVQVGVTQTGLGVWDAADKIQGFAIGAGFAAGGNDWLGRLAHPANWTIALTQPEIAEVATV